MHDRHLTWVLNTKLSDPQGPEMCGLWTRLLADADPQNFLDPVE